MRDFETIRRSAIRRFHTPKVKSSHPFISGDTYRLMCDFEINSNFRNEFTSELFQSEDFSSLNYFISGDIVEEFSLWLVQEKEIFQPLKSLTVHNSDFNLTTDVAKSLLRGFEQVFAVNWVGHLQDVHPIPIGLENFRLLRNGVPRDFKKLISKGLPKPSNRPIKILNNYSISTNPVVRQSAMDFFSGLEDVVTPVGFLTPKSYRNLLTQSQFVVSPPGNGLDCHRTWEAIYLGAVPIVLKNHWPFANFKLPVMIVDSWEEVPEKLNQDFSAISPKHLEELFLNSLSGRM